jgi:hypothetical protein
MRVLGYHGGKFLLRIQQSNVMPKFLNIGLSLQDVIVSCTVNPENEQ